MPGTIHVSVLDFKDLPSSIPPSSILIKVSMGKRECQTWGRGEFSFPLTTLRDNLAITIQDTEGNEVSHTVIQTMLVMEKGSWDEFLPLEGTGNVHMKLEFVLSEEERDRIRRMRESALKKKSGLLNSRLRCSETASTTGDIATSSLGINLEVSDSQSIVTDTHNDTVSIGDPSIHAGNEEGTDFSQIQITSNDTDGSEDTPSASTISKRPDMDPSDVNHSKSIEKIEGKLRHVDLPKRPVLFEEALFNTKKDSVASGLKNDRADQPEKQEPLGKTPSNVRNMISAFESSLTKDMRPGIKPPAAAKLQAKDPSSKVIAKPVKPTSERVKNRFLIGESQQMQTYEAKRGEHSGFDKDLNGTKLSQHSGKLKPSNITQIQVQETAPIAKNEWKRPNEDMARMIAVEAATVTEEGSGSGICSSSSHETNIQGSSEDNGESTAFRENEHSSCESSGAWIFPDHARRLCITTGSKQVVELVGSCGIQEQKSFSSPENLEKHSVQFGNYGEMRKGDETSHELRKPQLESSNEVESSNGPVGQAIKVVIMVAFGILVLLTRQRKPR